MCIVIGNLHYFIGHCFIPIDPWQKMFTDIFKVYNAVDLEGLFTLGTVVLDYRGYRVTAQSIIPGIIFFIIRKKYC